MTHTQEKKIISGSILRSEMTQILELADKHFKAGIITTLNKRKCAHDE